MRAWRGLRWAASSALSSGDGAAPGGRPRRRAWETSLSPLERVRRLLPPEEAAAVGRCAAAAQAPPQTSPEEEKEEAAAPQVPPEAVGARPGPFRAGELALAEMRRKHNTTLKLLCRLVAGSMLASPGGLLPHRDIIGQLPGQVLRTSAGARLLLRRPSLEEYVLLMPRGPTIAYPKDISAMLMMTDIHPGDTVLETGSGSGAMSLFLSRAVPQRDFEDSMGLSSKRLLLPWEREADKTEDESQHFSFQRCIWREGNLVQQVPSEHFNLAVTVPSQQNPWHHQTVNPIHGKKAVLVHQFSSILRRGRKGELDEGETARKPILFRSVFGKDSQWDHIVGPKGRVISYEIRDDHHNLAKKNYRHWRAAWEIGHMEEWPDNVDFILKDISTAAADMKSITLDAIVLDMLNPQTALPVVHPSLKQGGVCAVYLANITQVIDLLDRIRTCKLPFLCERIIEVTHRNWLVLPAKIKNCKSSQMVETQENIEEPPQKEYKEIHIQDQVVLKESEYNESLSDDAETYRSVPYVARPSYWQDAHSAFLAKLRKFQPLLS